MIISIKHIAVVILTMFFVSSASGNENNTGALLEEIRTEIDNTQSKDSVYESGIERLKAERNSASSKRKLYEINHRIFKEYESYKSDSALKYINFNLALATQLGDEELNMESLIEKCSVLSKAGFFMEALEILGALDKDRMTRNQLETYYHTYFDTYQYLLEYAINSEYAEEYGRKVTLYRDSTLMHTVDNSFYYESLYPTVLIENKQHEKAEKFLLDHLKNYKSGMREYSILSSLLAYNAQEQGKTDQQTYYLAESALSDIRGSIKENMSIRALAEQLYDNSDIDGANLLLKKSLDDAVFFSSRLRNNQSASVLPLINDAYEEARNSYNSMLVTIILTVSFLSLCMIILIVVIARQMKRKSAQARILAKMTQDLNDLNKELNEMNSRINEANRQLVNANNIKQVSVRYFMELCSTSINNLERFRTTLYNKMVTGKTEEMRKLLNSTQSLNDSLREFYSAFDSAFLSIFPTFVEEFNHLFTPENAISVKAGERLNRELRIYALIRLGITDSQRIADFLRCSLSTIYTYRSRIRNRSLYPDDFEERVMNL